MMSGDGWDYEDEAAFVEEAGPSWSCPDATCHCDGDPSEDKLIEHRIVLFDENAERMPGARCRVFIGRRVINDAPNADNTGAVVVRIPKHVKQVLVEWAPAHMPREPLYPFRCRYFTNLDVEAEEATRRSLHNLGYASYGSVDDNATAYQRAYRREPVPRWEHVADELVAFHDGGLLPALPRDEFERSHFTLAQAFTDDGSDRPDTTVRNLLDDDDDPAGPALAQPMPPPQTGFRRSNAGGAGNPPTSRVRFTIQSAVVLTVEPRRFLRFIQDATLTFDGSRLQPPVATASFTTNRAGELDVFMPSATGDVKVTVMPPDRWLNPTKRPAGPALSDHVRGPADLALDGVANRRDMHARRHTAEKRLGELEKQRTHLVLTNATPAAIAAVETRITADRRALDAVRRDLRASAHVANTQFAAAVPEFMFRPFELDITLGPGGRAQLRSRTHEKGAPPLVRIQESTGRVQCRWFPDWVRAPAYRIGWQRPISESAVARPEKGLGGDSCLVLHATGPRLAADGSVLGPMSLAFGVANFTANLITRQNSRPGRNDAGDVSVHYLVARSGHTIKLVDERFETFHAGGTIWRRHTRVNARSVGIEILNDATQGDAYRPAQIETVERLVHEIMGAFSILPRNVIGHGELQMKGGASRDRSLSRDRLVSDPGTNFPWVKLADQHMTFERIVGLPVVPLGPTASPAKIRLLKQKLLALGYTMSVDNRAGELLDGHVDSAFLDAYNAFQLRWYTEPRRKPLKPTPAPDETSADLIIAGIDLILSRPFNPRVL